VQSMPTVTANRFYTYIIQVSKHNTPENEMAKPRVYKTVEVPQYERDYVAARRAAMDKCDAAKDAVDLPDLSDERIEAMDKIEAIFIAEMAEINAAYRSALAAAMAK